MEDFLAWVYDKAQERMWSVNRLAKEMGFSGAAVHATMNGKNKVTWDFCAGVAKAFGVPAEDVFRKAGLLRPVPDPEGVKALMELVKNLGPEDIEDLTDFARWRFERAAQKKSK